MSFSSSCLADLMILSTVLWSKMPSWWAVMMTDRSLIILSIIPKTTEIMYDKMNDNYHKGNREQ